MIISVKDEHIKKGELASCFLCPVALALIDAGLEKPYVAYEDMEFIHKGKLAFCTVPISVAKFIDRFDLKKPVKPFNFRIKVRSL